MSNDSVRPRFLLQNAVLAARLSKKIETGFTVHGISFNEYVIMEYLAARPERGVPRIELAEYMGMSASGVTRLVLPMEKNRVVERETNSRDARQSLVKLTSTGRRVFAEARDSFEQIALELTRNVSSKELAAVIDAYRTLM